MYKLFIRKKIYYGMWKMSGWLGKYGKVTLQLGKYQAKNIILL